MLFNSVDFLIFFPVVCIVFFLLPKKVKNLWLLLASLYFYASWNVAYLGLLIFTILLTFYGGLLIKKSGKMLDNDSSGRILSSATITGSFAAVIIAVLFYFKYCNFFIECINRLVGITGGRNYLHTLDILLPVGISFFTFQSLGYLIDVYRGKVEAEESFIDYALFVSFFPQLVAGPIERSKNLLSQIKRYTYPEFKDLEVGALMMVWGYFMKLCIADRISRVVDTVYAEPDIYGGSIILVATILFGIQIYCDFNGYTMIARGVARIMGYRLMENFQTPYLASNVSDFWRRWHISLTGWFKDYVYIPLGGNRCGKFRKHINLMIVFLLSGLWHGASLSFVFWGGLNGLYQIVGDYIRPLKNRIEEAAKGSIRYVVRIFESMITFALVDFAWIFFRAGTLTDSVSVISRIPHLSLPSLFDGTLYTLGLDRQWFLLAIFFIIVLLVGDLLKYNGLSFEIIVSKKGLLLKGIIFLFLFILIFLFGVYGNGYDVTAFLYFQF